MKVNLIASLSANGQVFLTGKASHTATQEALNFFIQKVGIHGNVIIGSKTLSMLQQFPGGIRAIFQLLK